MSENETKTEDGAKSEAMQGSLVTKREKCKGHYRIVTREKATGRIVSVKKWSPRSGKASENTEPRSQIGRSDE